MFSNMRSVVWHLLIHPHFTWSWRQLFELASCTITTGVAQVSFIKQMKACIPAKVSSAAPSVTTLAIQSAACEVNALKSYILQSSNWVELSRVVTRSFLFRSSSSWNVRCEPHASARLSHNGTVCGCGYIYIYERNNDDSVTCLGATVQPKMIP